MPSITSTLLYSKLVQILMVSLRGILVKSESTSRLPMNSLNVTEESLATKNTQFAYSRISLLYLGHISLNNMATSRAASKENREAESPCRVNQETTDVLKEM